MDTWFYAFPKKKNIQPASQFPRPYGPFEPVSSVLPHALMELLIFQRFGMEMRPKYYSTYGQCTLSSVDTSKSDNLIGTTLEVLLGNS